MLLINKCIARSIKSLTIFRTILSVLPNNVDFFDGFEINRRRKPFKSVRKTRVSVSFGFTSQTSRLAPVDCNQPKEYTLYTFRGSMDEFPGGGGVTNDDRRDVTHPRGMKIRLWFLNLPTIVNNSISCPINSVVVVYTRSRTCIYIVCMIKFFN